MSGSLSESGNLTYGINANSIISGLVLKERGEIRLGIAKLLITEPLSSKTVYSDDA